ncbi:MAG TPA: amidohydrolase family protein [Candidatus Methylomirabilis sp.]|nr:amidohydrolase family protein [Candidatus Methylomirabilis sp.]HSC71472.1 amidohydrolase family protein [Candidatus Methylomirabilis sp.]
MHLWNGEAGWPERPVAVSVEGERIRLAANLGEGNPAGQGEVFDFGDATVLPGLIDMHTHLGINHRTGDIRAQMRDPVVRHLLAGTKNIQADLESGVTTAKLNGDKDLLDVQMRDAIQEGLAEGPRLFVSGRGIKSSRCTGGVVATCVVDDAAGVGGCVEENLRAGVDWIKLFASGSAFGPLAEVLHPFYGFPQISAALRLAHASGKRMSVHCFGGEAADACLRAGVDVIDHGWLLAEAQLEAMARQGTWLCPTLGVLTHPEGALAHLPAGRVREEGERRVEQVRDVARKALRIGVPLLVGTDSLHGCLSYELKLFQDMGGKPATLLQAATGNAAKVLGLSGEIGAVREGARADLLVVRGNAIRDVGCLADVLMVIQAGRIVRHEEHLRVARGWVSGSSLVRWAR